MRPYQAILALESLSSQMVGPLRRGGQWLCPKFLKDGIIDDRQTVVDVYTMWICLLLDLGYLRVDRLKTVAERLFIDMMKKDVLDLNQAMTEILMLVRAQESKGFKRLCRRISGHLYNLVKDDITKSAQNDYLAARRLIQLFSFTSRLSLKGIDLSAQCVKDYLDTEAKILSSFPEDLISEMNNYVRSWMKALDLSQPVPKHGPGGVADVPSATLEQKYRFLSTNQLIEYAYGEPYWIHQLGTPCERVSKTIFVPKSYKTFRTISMEPATLQYLQQGVWRQIREYVERSSFLRNHIGFVSQDRNRQLAHEGSLNRNFATIDLSAASDSVSYALVKKVFKGTKLLRYLVALRSQETRLAGQRVVLRKFAPMGSALCFPVETILFAAVCQCVTRRHGVPGDYSCYGDDLIVPTQCVGSLFGALHALGFRVNNEKSYFEQSSWFRESCGAEFCRGFDVTPIRVGRKYAAQLLPEEAFSLVDAANRAWEYRFFNLRAFYLRRVRQLNPLLLFGPDHLKSDEYTNFHLDQRWNIHLQRLEVRINVLSVRYRRSREDVRYRHWLESTQNRKVESVDKWGSYHSYVSYEDDYFVSRVGLPTVIIRKAWVEKPYHESDRHVYGNYRLMRE